MFNSGAFPAESSIVMTEDTEPKPHERDDEEAQRQIRMLAACLRELSSQTSAWESVKKTAAGLTGAASYLEALAEASGTAAISERLNFLERFKRGALEGDSRHVPSTRVADDPEDSSDERC